MELVSKESFSTNPFHKERFYGLEFLYLPNSTKGSLRSKTFLGEIIGSSRRTGYRAFTIGSYLGPCKLEHAAFSDSLPDLRSGLILGDYSVWTDQITEFSWRL